MADLVVNYDLLAEFQKNLTFVEQSFKALHGEVHNLDANNGWGSDEIRKAVGSFADNWSVHRSKLESSIDTLLQMVTGTTDAFQDADQQLAQSLNKDTVEAGGQR